MDSYLILLVGTIFSCLINSIIIFQFIDDMYTRIFQRRLLYFCIQIGIICVMIVVNLWNIPGLNLLSWIIVFGIFVAALYTDYGKRAFQRIFELVVLILILTVCETVGYLVLEFLFWKLGIDSIQPLMLRCLEITFSKVSILILYYSIINRIWKKGKQNKFTAAHYMVYMVIIVYSIINLLVIVVMVSNEKAVSPAERILLLINMFGIVFVDMFFLYFTKFTEENGQLKLKLRLLEQQSNLQYEYYVMQEQKYNESVKILHDVNKHLNMIEEIYENGNSENAKAYAKEIGVILKPLAPREYTNNPILNILLNDKEKYASFHDIRFQLEVGNIDLGFMEPVEVTTVFGNLLDNALEACEEVTKNKFIAMKLDTYNDFVAIQISNSTKGDIKWSGGKPMSSKGKNHGIGLMNVENIIKKYNGNMILEEKDGVFGCKIIFND